MPAQRPGKSEQDVTTPWALIDAVEARFGGIDFDLAASTVNCRVRSSTVRCHYDLEQNSLAQEWSALRGNLWLNPPFGKTPEAPKGLEHWTHKCVDATSEAYPNRQIFLLVPAATGSRWYANYVWDRARTILLTGRMRFVGHVNDYPKDLLLAVYSSRHRGGVELWDWKKQVSG